MAGAGPKVAVIVAHPDDEVLWAGGTMLLRPGWEKRVVTLCRAGDPDRAPRFQSVAARLGAAGRMADLEDGPEQTPLPERQVRATVMELIGDDAYDLLLTHGPGGEYTRHLRHEEVSRAVTALWHAGQVRARRVWLFAYADDGGAALSSARADAHLHLRLPEYVWREKYALIHDPRWYNFADHTKEARTTPRTEAFWCFSTPHELAAWQQRGGAVP